MLVRCPQLAPCGARLLDINKVFVVGEYTFHDISKMILISAYHCIMVRCTGIQTNACLPQVR